MLGRTIAFAAALLVAGATVPAPVRAATAPDCPNGGTVRFGIEPYESAARMVPAFDALAKLISQKLGCDVQIFIPTSYNAEIEAMRAGKLEAGEFGPLGYVLAHQIANADVIATYSDASGNPSTYYASIVTYPSSGIKTVKDLAGKTFAYSDPDSTSGHLFPAMGLRKAGIDPDTGVKPVYAGSHSASFEVIRNHKVDAGELNSVQIAAAQQANEYVAADWVTLWKSDPIPNDPIALRRDLPEGFKKRFAAVLLALNFSDLPPDAVKVMPSKGTTKYVAQSDAQYDVVRDLVKTLNIDLTKM